MTNNGVSQVPAQLGGLERARGQTKAQDTDTAFGMLLNQNTSTSGYQSTPERTDWSQGKNTDLKNRDVYQKEANGTAYRDKKITRADGEKNTEQITEKLTGKTDAFTEDVTKLLTEKLGITEEELLQAMEQLGMGMLDLLKPANLTELVMQVTGTEDASGLLFSEEFQTLFKEVGALTQDLLNELGLTQNELEGLLEQLTAGKEANDQTVLDQTVTEMTPEDGVTDIPKDASLKETLADQKQTDFAVKNNVVTDTENQQESIVENVDGNEEVTAAKGQGSNSPLKEDATLTGEAVKMPEDNSKASSQNTNQESGFQPEDGRQQTYQTVQTATNTASGEVTQVVQKTYVDVENVMRQVTEFTRLYVGTTESTMEMELNPAHLGKIYLQVAAKDGIITAHLAAQNEAVKEMLESQVAILKDNMNQQGLKVEAVEVTVASHEFEQNLEGNTQGQREPGQSGENSSKQRQNLTADTLSDLEGNMSEEEKLAAQIMLENGNRMDMTA